MKGTFEARHGDAVEALERWSVEGPALAAQGSTEGGRGATWTAQAAFDGAGALTSFEVQLSKRPPPTEVTTVVMRSFGGRAFITRIPPGGVPERLETELGQGCVVLGPSLALLGGCLAPLNLKTGTGRRAVFISLTGEDLEARLEDGIVLYSKRARGAGPSGEPGWLRHIEVKRASNMAVPDAALEVDDRTRAVVSAQLNAGPRALRAALVEFGLH